MVTKCYLIALLIGLLPQIPYTQELEETDTTRVRHLMPRESSWHAPFTYHAFTAREIRRLPFRGIQNYLTLATGVVQHNNALHVRGGRAGEIAYVVDGVSVTNRFFNSEGISIIPEAIERLEFYTGASGADFNGANSGLVHVKMRTGGNDFQYSVSMETDDVAKPGHEFLNTTAFGYRNLVGTIGGPLPYGMRLFLAGEHHYLRSRQPMVLEPMRFEDLVTDEFGWRPSGSPLPGPVEFKRNYIPNNWNLRNTLQGNLLVAPARAFNLRFTGSYSLDKSPEGGNWPDALRNYFRQNRNMMDETRTFFGAVQAAYQPGAATSYEVTLSWQDHFARLYDPDFGDQWQLYADSLANAQKGYTGFTSRYRGPVPYSTIHYFLFDDPNAPNTGYSKNKQTSFSAAMDFASRLTSRWELKAGASIESWKMRYYAITNIPYTMEYLYGWTGTTPRAFSNGQERRLGLLGACCGNILAYGYDVDGNEANTGVDSPRQPRFISTYVHNKIEEDDYALYLGARYEIFDLRLPTTTEKGYETYITSFDEFERSLSKRKATKILLPRIGLSTRLSQKIHSHIAFGKYAQMPVLSDMTTSNYGLWQALVMRPGYLFPTQIPPGHLLKPERATHYEAGITGMLAENLILRLTSFYKDLSDQAELGLVDTSGTATPIIALVNNGAGNVKGLEISLELLRTKHLAAKAYYTLSAARGTSSHPTSNLGPINNYSYSTNYPEFTSPLDYDTKHHGSILLDYRFNGGSNRKGAGLTALLAFKSGHPYTSISQAGLGCGGTSVWNWAVRSLADPRVGQALEAPNSSVTPWVFNVDLRLNTAIKMGVLKAELYLYALNVFNQRHILNVYPLTGDTQADGWFGNELSSYFEPIPGYVEFYNAINRDNRWAYMAATGNDIYGSPRQIRLGIRMER